MKPTTVIVALLLFVFVAVSAKLLMAPGAREAAAEEPRSDVFARLEELEREHAALQTEFADLRRQVATQRGDALVQGSSPDPRQSALSENEIERVVERFLERQRGPAKDETPLEPAPAELDLAAVMVELLDVAVDSARKAEIWKLLREAGQVEAVVAEFERRAEAAPQDSMARTELGWAYLQEMLSSENGPERGRWGQRGSDALTQALELDESNWDARFSLAVHQFYAEMKGDAIRNLGVLLEQQAGRAPQARHAQAYLWLGNIFMDRGDRQQALEVWSRGLALFPADASLKDRLDANR